MSGQSQGLGQDETRERATPLDTRDVQVWEVGHQEGGYSCECPRLDDETIAGAGNGIAVEVDGTQIRWNWDKNIEVLIDKNVMESQVDGKKHSGLSLTKSQW